METDGTIEGVPCTFVYDRESRDVAQNPPALRWKGPSQSEWQSIPLANVLAVEGASTSSFSTILLAARDEQSEKDPSISSLVFRTRSANNLPEAFISDFEVRSPLLSEWRRQSTNQHNGHPQIHVIISTGSGTGQAASVFEHLVKPLLNRLSLQEGHDYETHTTISTDSITALTNSTFLPRAQAGEQQLLILLSGDGGVLDIVNGNLSSVGAGGGDTKSTYINPTIALLPLGTGNALANSSAPPTSSAAAGAGVSSFEDDTLGLRALLHGSSRPVPLFRATFSPGSRLVVDEGQREVELEGRGEHGPVDLETDNSANTTTTTAGSEQLTSETQRLPVAYGAVVGSWGLHAALVADSDTVEYRRFGAERFKMAGKEALFPSDGSKAHGYNGRVSVLKVGGKEWEVVQDVQTRGGEGEGAKGDESKGEVSQHLHGYVLVSLVRCLEKGFTISPSSRPLDGRLWMVRFGPLDGNGAMDIMGKAYGGGTHNDDERVMYEEIEALRIDMMENDGQWRRVCIDGKIVRVEKGGWVEFRSGYKGVVDLIALDS